MAFIVGLYLKSMYIFNAITVLFVYIHFGEYGKITNLRHASDSLYLISAVL